MTSVLAYRDVQTAIELKLQLVQHLKTSPRAAWPQCLREFFERLSNLPIQDRGALLAILTAAAEEVRQITGGAHVFAPTLEEAFALNDIPLREVLRRLEADLIELASVSAAAAQSPRVLRLLAAIEEHYPDRLTVGTLARAVSRERGTMSSLFRRETGTTVHDYLTRVRIRHAADLVRRGEKIEAVMLMVGYRSKKSFYHQFRMRMGVTTGAYRLTCGTGRSA